MKITLDCKFIKAMVLLGATEEGGLLVSSRLIISQIKDRILECTAVAVVTACFALK